MDSGFFINLVDQYGYWIFYLALSFGPFGIPLPNEVIVTTSGLITGNGGLLPWLVYLCIVSGMITAVTVGFLIGKHFGNPLVEKLRKHRKYGRSMAAAERLFHRYGGIALFVSYFIPIIRYIAPVMAGASRIPYRTFAAVSYAGAVTWTLLFFGFGYLAGDELADALAALHPEKVLAPCLTGMLIVLSGIRKYFPAAEGEGDVGA